VQNPDGLQLKQLDQDLTNFEEEFKQAKRPVSSLKEEHQALDKQIVSMVQDILDGKSQEESILQNFRVGLEEVTKQLTEEFPSPENTEEQIPAQPPQLPKESRLITMRTWYSQLHKAIELQQGLAILEVTATQVKLGITTRLHIKEQLINCEHKLLLNFDDNQELCGAEIYPSLPLIDIVKDAVKERNSFTTLFTAIKSRIICTIKKTYEINELRKRFPVEWSSDSQIVDDGQHFLVKCPSGVICQFHIPLAYPDDDVPISFVSWHGAAQDKQKNMSEIKEEIEAASGWSLTNVIEYLHTCECEEKTM